MGFGILFFAFFLTYVGILTPLSTFTYVIGSALMMYSLYKLYSQNKFFLASFVGSSLLLVVSIIVVVMYVFGVVDSTFYNVMIYVQTFLAPLLCVVLMLAIAVIAKEVDLKKLQAWSIVNQLFIVIYLICDIISMFIKSAEAIKRLGVVCLVAQIIFTLFGLLIVFNCYARICYEDDRDMSKSSTGVGPFDFLNKMLNKAMDKNRKNGPKDKEDKK